MAASKRIMEKLPGAWRIRSLTMPLARGIEKIDLRRVVPSHAGSVVAG
jgi:hypothetical protein